MNNNADKLASIARRILMAHDTDNNGAVMGEAVLSRHFAEGLRHELAEYEAGKDADARRIIITVSGGVVGSVYADEGEPLNVAVLDYDELEDLEDHDACKDQRSEVTDELERLAELEAAIGGMTDMY